MNRRKNVTFKPMGYRDVYWCERLNEPVIIEYRGDEPERQAWCVNCDGPMDQERHRFICHVVHGQAVHR